MSRRHEVAIVTGGGRGIGQSAATALAADGLAVAAVARSEAAVERTAAEIQARDGRAAAIVGDVTDVQSVEEIVATAERQLGGPTFAVEPGLVRTEMSESLLSLEPSGVRASVVGMLNRLEADPGFVEPEESAQFIRLVATGHADDLAGEASSIYDPGVRSRVRVPPPGPDRRGPGPAPN